MSRLDDLMKNVNKKYGEVITEGQAELVYDKIPFTAPRSEERRVGKECRL